MISKVTKNEGSEFEIHSWVFLIQASWMNLLFVYWNPFSKSLNTLHLICILHLIGEKLDPDFWFGITWLYHSLALSFPLILLINGAFCTNLSKGSLITVQTITTNDICVKEYNKIRC